MGKGKKLTTNAGCPVVDSRNVMTADRRGQLCGFAANFYAEESNRNLVGNRFQRSP
jgi:catalase